MFSNDIPPWLPSFASLIISEGVERQKIIKDFWLFFFFNLFCLFLAALGLRCFARAFSSYGERGLLFVAVHRLLIAVASLVAEHGL